MKRGVGIVFDLLWQGMILGGTAAVQPGPIQAFLLSLTLRSGWRAALVAAWAPLFSDGPIIALVLLILTQTPAWFLNLLQIIGGCFLIYLARRSYTALVTPFSGDMHFEDSTRRGLFQSTLVNLLNPNPYLFWATIAGPILLEGWRISPRIGLAFLLGFYASLIGGFMGFVALFAVTGQMNPRVNWVLTRFSAALLLLFGLYQIGTGVFNWI